MGGTECSRSARSVSSFALVNTSMQPYHRRASLDRDPNLRAEHSKGNIRRIGLKHCAQASVARAAQGKSGPIPQDYDAAVLGNQFDPRQPVQIQQVGAVDPDEAG